MSELQCISCEKFKSPDEFSQGYFINRRYKGPLICVQCILEGAEKQRIIDKLDIDKGVCPACKESFKAIQSRTKFGKRCPH